MTMSECGSMISEYSPILSIIWDPDTILKSDSNNASLSLHTKPPDDTKSSDNDESSDTTNGESDATHVLSSPETSDTDVDTSDDNGGKLSIIEKMDRGLCEKHEFSNIGKAYEPIKALVNFVHKIDEDTPVFIRNSKENKPYGLWCQRGAPAFSSARQFAKLSDFKKAVKDLWEALLKGATGAENENRPVYDPRTRNTFWIAPT
ncbi:hypothetical protein F4810DRAFT_671906 [Camillea tinctor]|nr:hypothetical protein F4810DRAFT_671906 [Camillea tinctor]